MFTIIRVVLTFIFQKKFSSCRIDREKLYPGPGLLNVSIPEVNMLKNSSTLAVSVPVNLSIKLGFVSVNGPRETYFVDALRAIVLRYCCGNPLLGPASCPAKAVENS